MLGKNLYFDFILPFVFIIALYLLTQGLMLIGIIDDGVFMVNRLFLGFYQWVYLIPLIIYLKKRMLSFKGLLVSGTLISVLNILLIIWILSEPSKFI